VKRNQLGGLQSAKFRYLLKIWAKLTSVANGNFDPAGFPCANRSGPLLQFTYGRFHLGVICAASVEGDHQRGVSGLKVL
jgi:hypothetical protein